MGDRPHRRRERISVDNINSIDLNIMSDEELQDEINTLRVMQKQQRSIYSEAALALSISQSNLDETSRRLFRAEKHQARRRAGHHMANGK